MLRFSAIFVILLIQNHVVSSAPMCPIGDINPASCTENELMYLSEGQDICCPNHTPCTDTGMIATFFSQMKNEEILYATKIKDVKLALPNHDFKGYVEQKTGDDGRIFICPKPVNYLHYEIKHFKPADSIHATYLPTKNSDGKYKTCVINGDCEKGQYCGHATNFATNHNFAGKCQTDNKYCHGVRSCTASNPCVIDEQKWLHVEPTVKFCYYKPVPGPQSNEKMTNIQLQIRAHGSGFNICDADADCKLGDEIGYCFKGDLDQNGQKWTQYQEDGDKNEKKPGFRVHKSGVCAEAKPISFTLYQRFQKLSNTEKLGDAGLKFMAVDWAAKNYLYRDEMKKCAANSECGGDEFCDHIFHPNEQPPQSGFDKHNKFCFKKPGQPTAATSPINFTAPANLVGLVPCDTTADCRQHGTDGLSFCQDLGEKKWRFPRFADGKVTQYQGLCLEGEICAQPNRFGETFKWKSGGVPPTYSCTKNSECKDGGNTKDTENEKEVFEDVCMVSKPFNSLSACCYRQTMRCPGQNSKVIFPDKRCGKTPSTAAKIDAFIECYGDRDALLSASSATRDKWCDLRSNQCCQDSSPDAFCPDAQVPLYAEPECKGYDVAKVGSGICEQQNAPSIANGKVVKPEFSYITSQPCTPGSLPSQFSAGYCDPKSKKIVIIGLKSPKGIPLKKSPETPKLCQKDTDCSSDNSILCLRENSKDPEAYCYLDPLNEPAKKEEESMTTTIIIIVVIVILIIALAGIGGVLLYLKKKNKKKDGKKGKGKDKKGNEKDKKKEGKNDKKGGKKGKKGGGKGSKSKTKSKTPETGSKETGTVTDETGGAGV
ncbi:unnamed protein product [Caenorhabditis angaria]|uniref:Domain of unknown function DX domain-containing protein n=1 Tax=Caenorhabditis angaria TaxID=860376 RepID=A0A9P1MUD2_9PELO|nr:unnamed protein product [Caenorhabditis angaria]